MKEKIVFFGTPEFALESLIKISEKYNIVCTVTSPDKKSGRGQKVNESVIKIYSKKNNIPCLQPLNLNDIDFINKLKSIGAKLFVVVAFRKIPEEVFGIPVYGTINLHASLLPNYRGAAPINWALINGEKITGVTTFFINNDIDKGDIIMQKKVKILKDDNFGSLYERLSSIGSNLLSETILNIFNSNVKPLIQVDYGNLSIAPKLNKDNTRINWNKSSAEINNLIKGLNPKPGAWTELLNGNKKLKLKILEAEILDNVKNGDTPGKLYIIDNKIIIYTGSGAIKCEIVHLENKKKMYAKELLNGYSFDHNSHVY